jgi:tetratricopeptide (TPR) repeat protein
MCVNAYFGLGVLYDLEADHAASAKMYESAVKFSPSVQNRSNLAGQYFKAGQYKRAADSYAAIYNFPEAALESTKINLLMGKVPAAEESARVACPISKQS